MREKQFCERHAREKAVGVGKPLDGRMTVMSVETPTHPPTFSPPTCTDREAYLCNYTFERERTLPPIQPYTCVLLSVCASFGQ